MADRHGDKKSFLLSEPLDKNIFMRGFLADLYLRPSCYACPSKTFKSGSDITIEDFWGVQHVMPMIDDDKGVSVVMLNAIKGETYFRKIGLDSSIVGYEVVLRYNPSIEKSVSLTGKRKLFYSDTKATLDERIENLCRLTYKQRLRMIFDIILGEKVKNFIKRHCLSKLES